MLKEPRAGRVKTRLGKDIGMVPAAWWFRHQSRRLLRELEDPRWTITLAISPDKAAFGKRIWPAELPRIPQGQGDLGKRMRRQFVNAPRGPVCIIGADVPDISKTHVQTAFKTLASHDWVFGPAADGGYWLIGAKRISAFAPRVFQNVRWSTRHALADTIKTLPDARIALIDTLRDVDTLSDLKKFNRHRHIPKGHDAS